MDKSPNLDLPYILPSQAQKHVTHNEAIRRVDALVQLSVLSASLDTPPASPQEGDRHIIGLGPTGAWVEKANQIAHFIDGAWLFHRPRGGWIAWVESAQTMLIFDGTVWTGFSDVVAAGISQFQNLAMAGINATADTQNRLSVSSPSALFNHDGGSHQMKINKATAADTASLLLQENWSGRAELGLAGTSNMSIKVSSDGANWLQAMAIDSATGKVDFPAGLTVAGAPLASGNILALHSGIKPDGMTTSSTSETQITVPDSVTATSSTSKLLLNMVFSGLVKNTAGQEDAAAFIRPYYQIGSSRFSTYRNHLIGALDTQPAPGQSVNSFYMAIPATLILGQANLDGSEWKFGFNGRCNAGNMMLQGFGFSWTAMEIEA